MPTAGATKAARPKVPNGILYGRWRRAWERRSWTPAANSSVTDVAQKKLSMHCEWATQQAGGRQRTFGRGG